MAKTCLTFLFKHPLYLLRIVEVAPLNLWLLFLKFINNSKTRKNKNILKHIYVVESIIKWLSIHCKLLEVAKNAQKSFDRKSEFCFRVSPSVFAFRCQEFIFNQQYEPCLFSLSVNHCKQSQGKVENVDCK